VPAPAGLAGRSLLPILRNPTMAGKPAALTIVTRGAARGDTIRTERWRYIEWSDGSTELYDHANDPEETRNVALAHATVTRQLQQQLHAAHPLASRARR